MMKLLVILALIGACTGGPLPQREGFRGDEPTNVLIHSGYANIRRQGRMHDSGIFDSQKTVYKKGRTLDMDSIKNDIEKEEPAPVFKGFSDVEDQEAETHDLQNKVDAASKLAIEKMEKDIMNAIASTPSEAPVPESTTASPLTTNAPSTTPSNAEEEISNKEETTTTISSEAPSTTVTTSAPSTTVTTSAPSTTVTTSAPEPETEKTTVEEMDGTTTVNPVTTTPSQDLPEEEMTSTTSTEPFISTTKQQPPEEIDLGSVEEVIS